MKQDYAYTIQGWLKTVNGEQIAPQTMMGADGINSLNKQVAVMFQTVILVIFQKLNAIH
jgi:hypothetical protein